jgi:hypothetical protein
MNWQDNLIVSAAQIRELILETKRVAVLGIKTEAQAAHPAFYVPQYLVSAGFDVVPVPVYYPEVTEILGRKVFRKLTEIPDAIWWMSSDALTISQVIWTIYSLRNRRGSGFSRESAMTRLRSNLPERASKSSKTTA